MSAHRAADGRLDDPDWLHARHHTDGLSCQQIAEMTATSRATVQRRLAEHGIERRGHGEANIVHHRLHDPAWVAGAVVTRALTPSGIRAEVGAGEHAVREALRRPANVAAVVEAYDIAQMHWPEERLAHLDYVGLVHRVLARHW